MLLLLARRLMTANTTCADICQEMNDDDVPPASSGVPFELANWTCSFAATRDRSCFEISCVSHHNRNLTHSCQLSHSDFWFVAASCGSPADGTGETDPAILSCILGLVAVAGSALIFYFCSRPHREADVQAALTSPVPGIMVVDRLPGRRSINAEREEPLLP
jgi:hypothetical protein